MAFASGTVTLTTGAIGTTFNLGIGFTPNWIIFCWSGRATAGQGEADGNFGMGMATSTSSRRSFGMQSDHGNATNSQTDSMPRNDCCIGTITTVGGIGGLADINSMAGGVELIIDDVFPADLLVGFLAGTGDSVAIVDWDVPAATGDLDVATGFDMTTGAIDDKFVLSFSTEGGSGLNVIEGNGQFTAAIAAGNSITMAALSGASQDGVAAQVSCVYARDGEFTPDVFPDLVYARCTLTTWLSTGFRLNYSETSGSGNHCCALVVKGGIRATVGNAVTRTDTTNEAVATTYVPEALLVISAGRTESTADTVTAHMDLIVGAATGASARWAMAMMDKDAATTSDVGIAAGTTEMYINQSTATTIVQEGAMDLISFDATPSFTFVMDDADPAAAWFGYLSISGVGGAYNAVPLLDHYYRMIGATNHGA